MTTYNVKTVVVWDKSSYLAVTDNPADSVPPTPAMEEFASKQNEAISSGKMDPARLITTDASATTVSSIRYFTDSTAAQQWIDVNEAFASKYNFVEISSIIIG